MAEYIDKSTLLRSFAPIYEHDKYTGLTFETAKQIIANHINSLPTIDIVRCRDCKWIDLCKDPEYYEYKGANGFCSKGERMDEVRENG